jgi:hypothetical protein
MSVEYCAYPFLKEKSHLCDYEIATDRLASMLSVARHHIRHIPQEDLLQLMEMIYHANGSIRGACAIGEAELKKLNTFYARYHIEMDLSCPTAVLVPAICMCCVQKSRLLSASCIRYSVRESRWKPSCLIL